MSSILNNSLPLLFLPFLTRWLTPADYGVIGIFNAVLRNIEPFVSMGVPGAVGRSWFDRKDKNFDFNAYCFNALLVNGFLLAVVGTILWGASGLISSALEFPDMALMMVSVMIIFTSMGGIQSKLLILQERPLFYGTLQVSRSILNVAFSCLFLWTLWMDWQGRLSGIFLAEVIIGTVGIFFLFKENDISPTFRRDYIRDIFRFGLPLLPHSIGLILMNVADKFLISHFMGLKTLGTYSVAWAISSLLLVFSSAIDLSLAPWIYRMLKDQDHHKRRIYVLIFYGFFLTLLLTAFAMWVGISYVLPILVGVEFQDANQFILPLALANVAFSGYRLQAKLITFSKKNYILARISFISGLLAVTANYILIQNLGAMGAAYGTLLGYSILLILTWYSANRLYPMPWFRALLIKPNQNTKT